MKKFRLIASILLLGVYSVVVLHNIIPHFHCDSDSKITSTESSHHLHAGIHHSHNHDEHQEVESGWLDSLIDLLGDLEHHELGEGHFENFTAQNQNFNFDLSIIDVSNTDFIFENTLAFLALENNRDFDVVQPPIIYEQYFHCSSPLRGPPSIS